MPPAQRHSKPVPPSFQKAVRPKPKVSLHDARTLVIRVLQQAESGWLYGKNSDEVFAQLIEAVGKLQPKKELTREVAMQAVLKLQKNRVVAFYERKGTCSLRMA